jgi:hypothetical protein
LGSIQRFLEQNNRQGRGWKEAKIQHAIEERILFTGMLPKFLEGSKFLSHFSECAKCRQKHVM